MNQKAKYEEYLKELNNDLEWVKYNLTQFEKLRNELAAEGYDVEDLGEFTRDYHDLTDLYKLLKEVEKELKSRLQRSE